MGKQASYWSIDSIYPYEKPPFKEENVLIRTVHYTDYESPGVGKIVVHRDLLDKEDKVIDFGLAFDFNRSDLREYYKKVEFQGKSYRLPYFTPNNSIFLLNKRSKGMEEELKGEIAEMIGRANKTKSVREPAPDDRINLKREKPGEIGAKIFVFNVGQGDTILLELPGGELWMIDAYFMGRSRFHYENFKKWMGNRYGRLSIKRLVLSHLHYDHIKSAYKIVEDFKPEEVVFPPTLSHPTATVRNLFYKCSSDRGILSALSGDEVTNFSDFEVKLKRTADFSDKSTLGSDPNNHGIAVLIKTKKSFALLPGDIPGDRLYNLKNYYRSAQNKYRFYKVTHHCSYTGDHKEFLNALNPEDAATSCSKTNRFRHPNNPPKDFIDKCTRDNSGSHEITSSGTEPYLKYTLL